MDKLPDLLAPGLAVVFCGTAASRASAARGHYYAGPGNRFWAVLHAAGLTPRLLRPEDDHLLPAFGIGLTDLAKTAAGMDREIPPDAFAPAALAARLAPFRPGALAFTGKTAARIALGRKGLDYGRQEGDFTGIAPVWVLPSTSGAARGAFSLAPWHALAEALGRGGSGGGPGSGSASRG